MNNRTTGIVITLATVLLCGCPGLCGLCFGAMFALVSFIPNAKIDVFGSHEPQAALTFGVVAILISLVFLAIPAILAFITLRKKKATPRANPYEVLPPPI
jgi:hypothetical protein